MIKADLEYLKENKSWNINWLHQKNVSLSALWLQFLKKYSRYSYEDIVKVFQQLWQCFPAPVTLNEITNTTRPWTD